MTQVATRQVGADLQPIGTAVLYGDCDIIIASAVLLQIMDWRVTLVSKRERQDAIRDYLANFGDGPRIKLEAEDAQTESWPDCVVYCAMDGLPAHLAELRGGAMQIELSGVNHDDGVDKWQSCSDMIANMRSGLGMLTRKRGTVPPGQPFRAAGLMTSYFLALRTAFIAASVLNAPERPKQIKVTAQESLLAGLHFTISAANGPEAGRERQMPAQGQRTSIGGDFDCTDGQVFILTPTQDLWQPLVALLWKEEWSSDPGWKDITGTPEQVEQVNAAIAEYCSTRTWLDVVMAFQEAGAPTAYRAGPQDILTNPQAESHGFFTPSSDGRMAMNRPFRVEVADAASLGPASTPATPARPTKLQPFAGLTITDLSWWWAGPFSSMCLSLLGATVVKVEGRKKVDHHRLQRPFLESDEELYDRSFTHFQSGRGKYSLAVDLKHPDGLQAVRDLIAKSDILVSNFQPATLRRLGLGFEAAAKLAGQRPFLYGALSGFGGTGPWKDFRSFGANLAAFGSLNNLMGDESTGPLDIGIAIADPIGGSFAAAAFASNWQHAQRLGLPVHVDLSQFEAQEFIFNDGWRDGRQLGNWRPGDLAGTGVYHSSEEDGWVAVSIRSLEALNNLRSLLGIATSNNAPAADPDLDAALRSWASTRPRAEAARALRRAGVDATDVLSVLDLMDDPSLNAVDYWYRTGPEEGHIRLDHGPWLVDGARPARTNGAPRLGQHNEKVLTEIVGYSSEKVREMQTSGALE